MKVEGRRYFFTVVTYKRRSIFFNDLARSILKEAIQHVQSEFPFETLAFCLLPNHLHCIWHLPQGDCDFSKRWSMIKRYFSTHYIEHGGIALPQTSSRYKKRELGIWQRRFWEHLIRDREDFYNHTHYVHYNPVKHGLVKQVSQWPYSTYHQFLKQGFYKGFDWSLLKGSGFSEKIEFNE